MVKVVGPPVTAAACAPVVVHEIVNAPAARSTGSLKTTPRLSAIGTFVAPSTGAMPVTVGASAGGIVRNVTASSTAMRFGGSIASTSVTNFALTRCVQFSEWSNGVVWVMTQGVGPPVTVPPCAPLRPQLIENQPEARLTGSLNVTLRFEPTMMSVAPADGTVDWTNGASSSAAIAEMSSTPTHSSAPTALAVMIRTCTSDWSLAAAGSPTSTGVTSPARFGPSVASSTKPAGRLVKLPLLPTRYWTATGLIVSALVSSISRRL